MRRGRKAAGLHWEDGRAAEDNSLVSSAFLFGEGTIEKDGVSFELPSLLSRWGNSGGKGWGKGKMKMAKKLALAPFSNLQLINS